MRNLPEVFLWDKGPSKRGMHYKAWDFICRPAKKGGLGIHAADRWRGPLRARLAWSFIQQHDTMLSKCIAEKYGRDIWHGIIRRGASKVWNLLIDAAQSLNSSIRWRIGHGRTVSVLNHVWIWDVAIARWPTFVDVAVINDLKVSHFFDDNGVWRRDRIDQCFGPSLGDIIVMISANSGLDDNPEFIKLPIGRTITAITYEAQFLQNESSCYWVRKFQLHPREQIFGGDCKIMLFQLGAGCITEGLQPRRIALGVVVKLRIQIILQQDVDA